GVLVELAQELLPGVLEVRLRVGDDLEALDAHARAVQPHTRRDAVAPGGGVGVSDAFFLSVDEGYPGEPRIAPDGQVEVQGIEAGGRDHAAATLTLRSGGRPAGGRPGRGGMPRGR